MAERIVMPKLGLTMETAVVTSWLKKEGEKVEKGENLLEIETDKIVNEVKSPCSGTLLKILVEEESEVKVQTLLAVIGQPGEDIADIISPRDSSQDKIESLKEVQQRATASAPPAGGKTEINITPRARKLIAKHGLDPSEFAGLDKKRVTEDDVRKLLQQKVGQDISPEPTKDISGVKKVSLSGMRKRIADKMTKSKQTIPHIYFRTAVDATAINQLREQFAEKQNRPSFDDIIIKVVAGVLEEIPQVNVSLIDGRIIYNPQVNIGLAVGLEEGLIVPVIKNANKLSLADIHRITTTLIEKARNSTLEGDDVKGGTFTITNLGMYQIDEFTAIINPPESAILAIGKMQQRPCVREAQISVRPEMNLTLSVDHRVIDGTLAARFLDRIKTKLESLDGIK